MLGGRPESFNHLRSSLACMRRSLHLTLWRMRLPCALVAISDEIHSGTASARGNDCASEPVGVGTTGFFGKSVRQKIFYCYQTFLIKRGGLCAGSVTPD